MKQIGTYTKHYYIGAERISSVLGSVNSIGYRVCSSDFPTQTEITEMTQKVNQAGQALQEDYTYFEKQLNLSSTFEKHPGCGGGQTEPETPFWFHPDHLGSSSYISNKNKEISQHLEYFPFGETLVEEHKNSNNSPYRFNAKELDAETGNYYYYGARYLNPKFSIWLSVDPLAEKYPGWSPYNYTLLNPVKLIDPDGRSVDMPDNWIKYLKTGEVKWFDGSEEEALTAAAQYWGEDSNPITGTKHPENFENLGKSFFGNTKGNPSDKLKIRRERESYLKEVSSKINDKAGIEIGKNGNCNNIVYDYLSNKFLGTSSPFNKKQNSTSSDIKGLGWGLTAPYIEKKVSNRIFSFFLMPIDLYFSSQKISMGQDKGYIDKIRAVNEFKRHTSKFIDKKILFQIQYHNF